LGTKKMTEGKPSAKYANNQREMMKGTETKLPNQTGATIAHQHEIESPFEREIRITTREYRSRL